MTKKAYLSAQAKDYKNAKEQWLELVKILEANYSIKNKGNHEIFLNVPKEEVADIEVYLNGLVSPNTYSIQLWYLQLPFEYESLQAVELNTLQGVIDHIDKLLMLVKQVEVIK